jgi:hypothetical protein
MAIQIIQEVKASPAAFKLPHRVELDMTLSSTEPSEQCRFVYTLAEDNDVGFDDGSKREERDDEVARAATPVTHRVTFVQRATGNKPSSIVLTQDIFDSIGTRTRTRIKLTIDRGQS